MREVNRLCLVAAMLPLARSLEVCFWNAMPWEPRNIHHHHPPPPTGPAHTHTHCTRSSPHLHISPSEPDCSAP